MSQEEYVHTIRSIILTALQEYRVCVYFFGSRARGTAGKYSDYDIAIESQEPLPTGLLSTIRDRLEQSTVPFAVEIVDLADAAPDFVQGVKKEGILWKD